MLFLPVSVVSSRSFQYSTGVAAFLALALPVLLIAVTCVWVPALRELDEAPPGASL
jgi:hypothetical protein